MSDRVTVPPLEDLREAFAKFDTESSGAIGPRPRRITLRRRRRAQGGRAPALISEEMFDKNFDLPEFLALMVEIGHTLPAPGMEKKELRKAFKQAGFRWRRLPDSRRAAARDGRHGRPWSAGGHHVRNHAPGVQEGRGDRGRRAHQNRRGGPVLPDPVNARRDAAT